MKNTGQQKPREPTVKLAELQANFRQLQARLDPFFQGETDTTPSHSGEARSCSGIMPLA